VAADGNDGAGSLVPRDRSRAAQQATVNVAAAEPARESGRALRLLGLIAVALGLATLTAAACVLSYSSIHHLAIEAGVSRRLAAIYPFIFDALLVIAGCAVLALRGAGLPSKIYAWFCLLVLLGALAAGGAARAAAIHIPHRLAGIVAAVVPWALVLIGFGLLLALLRYARIRRQGRSLRPARGQTASARQDPDPPAPSEIVVIANVAEPASAQPQPAAEPVPTVRQAEMRLRARIPRQSAERPQAGQDQAGHDQPPFMPPVGGQPVGEPTNPRPVAGTVATGPAEAESTGPTSDQEAAPDDGSTLNPAPVDDQQADPPALQRPRSSPVPPGD
jgi:hypothetical protein